MHLLHAAGSQMNVHPGGRHEQKTMGPFSAHDLNTQWRSGKTSLCHTHDRYSPAKTFVKMSTQSWPILAAQPDVAIDYY
jgi:hypothetical protein